LEVPERRATVGSTPTPSSRQTISTTGEPLKVGALPEAGPSAGSAAPARHREPL